MFSSSYHANADYVSLGELKPYRAEQAWISFSRLISWWREITIAGLCFVIGILSFNRAERTGSSFPANTYRLVSGQTHWQQFRWHSERYGSPSHAKQEAINTAWEAIIPAHGIVAVDHDWAAEHHLPKSMSHPHDFSKGVYYIDAYHQLHCLTVLQKTLGEIARGQETTFPVEHSRHCLDSLLQYVVCGTPGDTLLYTWGQNTTGDGQVRECIDWQSRAEWAKENSACFADVGAAPIYMHFGHCETSVTDGVEQRNGWMGS